MLYPYDEEVYTLLFIITFLLISFQYSPELVSMTTRFTDELMQQGLTYKVLTLVSQIDVNNEFEKLQRERGLGSEKHRKEARVQ